MSLALNLQGTPKKRFPRVSGDEPHTTEAGLGLVKFSPRERG